MNKTATILQPADQEVHSILTTAAEEDPPFRLSTALPVGIFGRGQRENGCESAVLREVSARACRIDTQKPLDIGSALAVRVGVNYLDCIVRDIESAPHGFTAKLQILPTRNGVALLDGLERLLTAVAVSRLSGDG
jgi:hypothetical protein